MTEIVKQKLIESGREDLVKIFEINQSGYAGVLPNGNIVDRRKHPEAIPVRKNTLLNIPAPKYLVVPHFHQIADTGDYDGVYEITNGSVSLLTKEDDVGALLAVAEELHRTQIEFFSNDDKEFELKLAEDRIKLLEERCSHYPVDDLGDSYACPACYKTWTYDEWEKQKEEAAKPVLAVTVAESVLPTLRMVRAKTLKGDLIYGHFCLYKTGSYDTGTWVEETQEVIITSFSGGGYSFMQVRPETVENLFQVVTATTQKEKK